MNFQLSLDDEISYVQKHGPSHGIFIKELKSNHIHHRNRKNIRLIYILIHGYTNSSYNQLYLIQGIIFSENNILPKYQPLYPSYHPSLPSIQGINEKKKYDNQKKNKTLPQLKWDDQYHSHFPNGQITLMRWTRTRTNMSDGQKNIIRRPTIYELAESIREGYYSNELFVRYDVVCENGGLKKMYLKEREKFDEKAKRFTEMFKNDMREWLMNGNEEGTLNEVNEWVWKIWQKVEKEKFVIISGNGNGKKKKKSVGTEKIIKKKDDDHEEEEEEESEESEESEEEDDDEFFQDATEGTTSEEDAKEKEESTTEGESNDDDDDEEEEGEDDDDEEEEGEDDDDDEKEGDQYQQKKGVFIERETFDSNIAIPVDDIQMQQRRNVPHKRPIKKTPRNKHISKPNKDEPLRKPDKSKIKRKQKVKVLPSSSNSPDRKKEEILSQIKTEEKNMNKNQRKTRLPSNYIINGKMKLMPKGIRVPQNISKKVNIGGRGRRGIKIVRVNGKRVVRVNQSDKPKKEFSETNGVNKRVPSDIVKNIQQSKEKELQEENINRSRRKVPIVIIKQKEQSRKRRVVPIDVVKLHGKASFDSKNKVNTKNMLILDDDDIIMQKKYNDMNQIVLSELKDSVESDIDISFSKKVKIPSLLHDRVLAGLINGNTDKQISLDFQVVESEVSNIKNQFESISKELELKIKEDKEFGELYKLIESLICCGLDLLKISRVFNINIETVKQVYWYYKISYWKSVSFGIKQLIEKGRNFQQIIGMSNNVDMSIIKTFCINHHRVVVSSPEVKKEENTIVKPPLVSKKEIINPQILPRITKSIEKSETVTIKEKTIPKDEKEELKQIILELLLSLKKSFICKNHNVVESVVNEISSKKVYLSLYIGRKTEYLVCCRKDRERINNEELSEEEKSGLEKKRKNIINRLITTQNCNFKQIAMKENTTEEIVKSVFILEELKTAKSMKNEIKTMVNLKKNSLEITEKTGVDHEVINAYLKKLRKTNLIVNEIVCLNRKSDSTCFKMASSHHHHHDTRRLQQRKNSGIKRNESHQHSPNRNVQKVITQKIIEKKKKKKKTDIIQDYQIRDVIALLFSGYKVPEISDILLISESIIKEISDKRLRFNKDAGKEGIDFCSEYNTIIQYTKSGRNVPINELNIDESVVKDVIFIERMKELKKRDKWMKEMIKNGSPYEKIINEWKISPFVAIRILEKRLKVKIGEEIKRKVILKSKSSVKGRIIRGEKNSTNIFAIQAQNVEGPPNHNIQLPGKKSINNTQVVKSNIVEEYQVDDIIMLFFSGFKVHEVSDILFIAEDKINEISERRYELHQSAGKEGNQFCDKYDSIIQLHLGKTELNEIINKLNLDENVVKDVIFIEKMKDLKKRDKWMRKMIKDKEQVEEIINGIKITPSVVVAILERKGVSVSDDLKKRFRFQQQEEVKKKKKETVKQKEEVEYSKNKNNNPKVIIDELMMDKITIGFINHFPNHEICKEVLNITNNNNNDQIDRMYKLYRKLGLHIRKDYEYVICYKDFEDDSFNMNNLTDDQKNKLKLIHTNIINLINKKKKIMIKEICNELNLEEKIVERVYFIERMKFLSTKKLKSKQKRGKSLSDVIKLTGI